MGEFPNKDTQFKPGHPGGPGRPKERPITDALKSIADEVLTVKAGTKELTGTRLELLAMVAWRRALSGDYRWGRELLDRIDGKVLQEMNLLNDGGAFGAPTEADDDLDAALDVVAKNKGVLRT